VTAFRRRQFYTIADITTTAPHDRTRFGVRVPNRTLAEAGLDLADQEVPGQSWVNRVIRPIGEHLDDLMGRTTAIAEAFVFAHHRVEPFELAVIEYLLPEACVPHSGFALDRVTGNPRGQSVAEAIPALPRARN
jgi:hypothetical protein